MDKRIKECITKLCGEDFASIEPFGKFIESLLFVSLNMSLTLKESGDYIIISFPKNENTEDTQRKLLLTLVELVTVMKQLEGEGMIYLLDSNERGDLVYNEKTEERKALETHEEKYEIKKLYDELRRYLSSFIYPTNELSEFVKHSFKNKTDYTSHKALFWSCISFVVAIVVPILAAMLATLFGNCYGHTRIEKEQYNEMKAELSAIKSELKKDSINIPKKLNEREWYKHDK